MTKVKADNEVINEEVINDEQVIGNEDFTDEQVVNTNELIDDEIVDDSTKNANSTEEIDKTKAFSDRLKKKTEEIQSKFEQQTEKRVQEELDAVAQLKGYTDWNDFQKGLKTEMLIESGIEDPEKFEEKFQKLISENPAVIKANKILKQQENLAIEQAQQHDISLINKVDSSINSLDDIANLPNCKEIIAKIEKGYSLYDAYCVSNLDKIQLSKVESGKKQAQNNIDNKDHLKNIKGQGGTQLEVPSDVMAIYKANTKMTDEQIRNHYRKTMGE